MTAKKAPLHPDPAWLKAFATIMSRIDTALGPAKPKKPVVAYVAGVHAPTDRRMGHAGTVDVFGEGSAAQKIEALKSAGAIIAANAAEMGRTMRKALRGR